MCLSIPRVGVDDLEPIHTRHAQLRAQQVDQTRLHGDVELLVDPQRAVPAP
jgi:hypothetical protein